MVLSDRRQGRSRRETAVRPGIGTGTTSLILIFTLLCLATLALLSLTTALSDQRSQQRAMKTALTQAQDEGLAAVRLFEIDAVLLALQNGAADDVEAYYAAVEQALTALGCEYDAQARAATFTVASGDRTELVTQVRVQAPGGAARYETLRQVSRSVVSWNQDENRQFVK